MLLERDLIQSVGFRNVREGERITGSSCVCACRRIAG